MTKIEGEVDLENVTHKPARCFRYACVETAEVPANPQKSHYADLDGAYA